MVSVQSKYSSSNRDSPMLSSGRKSQCVAAAALPPTDSGSIDSLQELSIQAASASSYLLTSNDVHSSYDDHSSYDAESAQACISSLLENPPLDCKDSRSEINNCPTYIPSKICSSVTSSRPCHDVAPATATLHSLSHFSAALVPTKSRVRAYLCSHTVYA